MRPDHDQRDAGTTRPRPAARGRQHTTVGRVVRALRGERAAGFTAIGLVGALIAAAVGLGGGAHALLPRLADIGAWLGDDSKGSVTHANGLAGKADARVTLRNAAGHPLRVTQDGDIVIVTDTVTGTVTRIDPAQLSVTQSVSYGSAGVQVVAGAGRAYVVDPPRGLVQAIDPERLSAVGDPVSLPAPLGSAQVDGRGTLWVPVPSTGALVPVTGTGAGTPVPVGSPGDGIELTIAGGVPVATDPGAATMTVLPADGGRRTITLPVAGTSLLAPEQTDGAVVPLLAAGSDQLLVVDTATARPTAVALDGLTRDDLGAPQALGGRVYIPDDTTGRLIVYDTAAGRMLNQITVSGRGGRLELFTHDGMLWANDASGSAAVSIDASGAVHTISKYRPDLPGGPLPVATPGRDGGWNGDDGGNGPSGAGGGNGQHGGQGNGGGRTGTPTPAGASPTPPPTSTPPAAPPDAPHNVSETGQPGSILVAFSPSAGATPTGYTLSGVPAGASVTPATLPPGGPYQFLVSGLTCTQRYVFTVVAGYPTGSMSASGGGALPCVAPSAPRKLSLNVSRQEQIGVSWQVPASDGGGSLTYTVSGGGRTLSGITGTSTTLTGLSNFRTYTVTVAAVNLAGASQPPASGNANLSPGRTWSGTIGNNSLYAVNERSSPNCDTASCNNIVASYPAPGGQKVTVKCVTNGAYWQDPGGWPRGSTWYRITWPTLGYIATGYVLGPTGVWNCDGAT